jgi:MFS family permease
LHGACVGARVIAMTDKLPAREDIPTSHEAAGGPESTGSSARIIRSYFLLWMIFSLASGLILSFYPVFLRAHGLTQLQANTVLAVSFVVVFLADVPTGAFADAAGRSLSFTLGNAIRSLGWLLYYFTSSFWPFIAADSTAAVGFSFANGALEAWAVDALNRAGYTGDKSLIFSRVAQLTALTAMAGAIIGAYAAAYSLRLPWALGSGVLMTTAIAGKYLMAESIHPAVNAIPLYTRIRMRLFSGFAAAGKNRTILMLALASSLQIGAWTPFEMEWQKFFMDSMSVRIGTIGLIFCLFRLANIAGSQITARYQFRAGTREPIITGVTAISGVFLLMAARFISQPLIVLTLLALTNIGFGLGGPLVRTWANEEITSEYRATLLSLFSTFGTVGGASGLVVGGRLADVFGLGPAWAVSGVAVLMSVPLLIGAAAYSQKRRLAAAG